MRSPVFSSSTCDVCDAVIAKARVLESSQVAVSIVDFDEKRALHEKYEIDAVPTLLISDAAGVLPVENASKDGMGVGGGIFYRIAEQYRVNFDYAYRHFGTLGSVDVFSVTFGWN